MAERGFVLENTGSSQVLARNGSFAIVPPSIGIVVKFQDEGLKTVSIQATVELTTIENVVTNNISATIPVARVNLNPVTGRTNIYLIQEKTIAPLNVIVNPSTVVILQTDGPPRTRKGIRP
ncbi:MAG: hypothetical protein KatS3mg105_2612 [Gemmatales bacterium]|nr:MAG: hypothetical protein KatS3mg105_2612 [Gemmatales bacterium]